jgi:hypothetical protein
LPRPFERPSIDHPANDGGAAGEQKTDAPIARLKPSQLPADGLFVAKCAHCAHFASSGFGAAIGAQIGMMGLTCTAGMQVLRV